MKATVIKRRAGERGFIIYEGTNEQATLYYLAYRSGMKDAGVAVKNIGGSFTVRLPNGDAFDIILREVLA